MEKRKKGVLNKRDWKIILFCMDIKNDLQKRVKKAMGLKQIEACDYLAFCSSDYNVRAAAEWRMTGLKRKDSIKDFIKSEQAAYLEKAKAWVTKQR